MENKQTAVEYIIDVLATVIDKEYFKTEIDKAKAMEKEQIKKTAIQCHFEGVRQSAKTSQEYIDYAEQYYNETYGK